MKPMGYGVMSTLLGGMWIMGALTSCDSRGVRTLPEQGIRPAEQEETAGWQDERAVILFFGDSLTAGFRLDPEDAYPAVIQQKIDAVGYAYRVVNAGVSGDTTADGVRRMDWVLRQPVAVFVLALGANDALRGHPPALTDRNLRTLLERVRTHQPDVRLVVAGMKMPPNYGAPYAAEFEALYPALARDHGALFIPFLLKNVATRPELNLEDGIHPNEAGHAIIARDVWRYLKPLLTPPPSS